MSATGKRHDFLIEYEAGFDDEGTILGADFTYARAAASPPISPVRSPIARCFTATTLITIRR